MKIFICYRSIDKIEGDKTIATLLKNSENSVAVLKQTEHLKNLGVANGKPDVELKLRVVTE